METAFAVIQKCLEGEISGLGYPRAALFSYAVRCSPSMCSSLLAAMRAVHGKAKIEQSFSTHHMAEEIRAMWPGMTLRLTTAFWESRCRGKDDAAVARELRRLAKYVDLAQYKKATRTTRHPPPKRKKSSKYTPHISTGAPGKKEMTALKCWFMKAWMEAIMPVTQKLVQEHQQGMMFYDMLNSRNDSHYAGKDVKLGTPDHPIFWYSPQVPRVPRHLRRSERQRGSVRTGAKTAAGRKSQAVK